MSLADYQRQYYLRNRDKVLTRQKAHHKLRVVEIKVDVLTHYGKDGHLQCCWPDCPCIDPDMLTLDHVKNDGAKHRLSGFMPGVNGYRVLQKAGYPEGFQTLCWNHQWKKELMRRRMI